MIARELAADPQVSSPRSPRAAWTSARSSSSTAGCVEERDEGRAVLLVSLELEEIRSLTDRVLVIYEGEIVAELPPDASEEDFGVAMTGGGRRSEAGRVSEPPERRLAAGPTRHVAARLSTYLRGGGVITPLMTVLVAFLVGGLVVLVTGHDPIATYKAIFDGTGLNWLFPWTSADDRATAAINLQQTLIQTTPLILTGLAVAFAFRCGLFNIGGQGQYLVGSLVAVWVGSSFHGHAGVPAHRARDRSSAALAGARVGGRSRAR